MIEDVVASDFANLLRQGFEGQEATPDEKAMMDRQIFQIFLIPYTFDKFLNKSYNYQAN